MNGPFSLHFCVETPLSVECLREILSRKINPPDRGWLSGMFEHRYTGWVNEEGFSISSCSGRNPPPPATGTFRPLPRGTEVDVCLRMHPMGYVALILPGALLTLPAVLIGGWFLYAGSWFGVFVIAGPVALGLLIAFIVWLCFLMQASWERSRLTQWLTDASELPVVDARACQG